MRRIAATGRWIQGAGGATRTWIRDRGRAAGKRAHGIAAKLRSRTTQGRDEALATVRRITGHLAGLAERAAHDVQRLLVNAPRGRAGRRRRPPIWPPPATVMRPPAADGVDCAER